MTLSIFSQNSMTFPGIRKFQNSRKSMTFPWPWQRCTMHITLYNSCETCREYSGTGSKPSGDQTCLRNYIPPGTTCPVNYQASKVNPSGSEFTPGAPLALPRVREIILSFVGHFLSQIFCSISSHRTVCPARIYPFARYLKFSPDMSSGFRVLWLWDRFTPTWRSQELQ